MKSSAKSLLFTLRLGFISVTLHKSLFRISLRVKQFQPFVFRKSRSGEISHSFHNSLAWQSERIQQMFKVMNSTDRLELSQTFYGQRQSNYLQSLSAVRRNPFPPLCSLRIARANYSNEHERKERKLLSLTNPETSTAKRGEPGNPFFLYRSSKHQKRANTMKHRRTGNKRDKDRSVFMLLPREILLSRC